MARSKGSFKAKEYEILTPEIARYRAEAEGWDVLTEYKRMRKTAEERLRKLKKGGLGELEIVTENVNKFPRLSEIGADRRMLYDAVAEVTRFLGMKKSTVGGYKEYEQRSFATFARHYGIDVGGDMLHWRTYGALMDALKGAAKSGAWYSRWKHAYRAVQENAKKTGLTPEELGDLIGRKKIRVARGGGLYDTRTAKRIRGKWNP